MFASMEAVIAALDAFVPDGNDDTHHQYVLLDGFGELTHRERAVPAMFALLERFPEADFGSPGPLVHELELISGYETALELSLIRQPTDLTVWMVNRIINASTEQAVRGRWLAQLRAVLEHPLASARVRESAAGFIKYQLSGT